MNWQRLDALFDRAASLEAEEQRAFVDDVRREEAGLARDLERLLAADRAAEGFLASPVARVELAPPAAPERIGPYRVLRILDEGGMGRVYLAAREDDEFERLVAIKLLRPDRNQPDLRRRFLRERQILAGLEHPNIARMYDGGTLPDGQPYLVMEVVEGEALDAYCDRRRLGTEARLRLFEQVTDAVSYAHRNLVVHRDLKPSNIRVTADGVVKLLDFGIARGMEPGDAGSEEGPATRTENRMMTLAYASPEQILGRRIGTASDVYSLGVVLYELLSGLSPYPPGSGCLDLHRAVLEGRARRPSEAIREAIREAMREASRDATRGPGQEDAVGAIARARGTDPQGLARRLRGDLGTILLKALRREPEHRYRSVEEMAEDLARYRDTRPIRARPASFGYQARRFVERHRLPVFLALAMTVLLAVFVSEKVRQARRLAVEKETAVAAAHMARQERAHAERVSGFLFELLEGANPWVAGRSDATVRELLDRAAAEVGDLGDDPDLQEEAMIVLGRIYGGLGDYPLAEELLRGALARRRARFGEGHLETANAYRPLGLLLAEKGDYREAEAMLRPALAVDRRHAGDRPVTLARTQAGMGRVLRRTGRLDEAELLLRESTALLRATVGSPSEELADALHELGALLEQKSEWPASLAALQEGMSMRMALFGEGSVPVAASMGDLAAIYHVMGDYDRAIELRQASLDIQSRELPEGHPQIATSYWHLAAIHAGEGRYAEAVVLHCRALDGYHASFGPEHQAAADVLHNLACILHDGGNPAASLALGEQALTLWRERLGEKHWKVAAALLQTGLAGLSLGGGEESLGRVREGFDRVVAALGVDHPTVRYFRLELGRALLFQGRPGEALPHLEEAEPAYVGVEDHGWATHAYSQVLLGAALSALGRTAEAEEMLLGAYDELAEAVAPEYLPMRDAAALLAEHFERTGARREAASYRERLAELPPWITRAADSPRGDVSIETICEVAAERPQDLFRLAGAEG